MKQWRLGLLGLMVSGLAIYFIASQIDPARFSAALRAGRYAYIVPGAGLLVAGLVARAVRWRVLLAGALPFSHALSILNISYLVNGILPLRAGELARAFLATRTRPPVAAPKAASTILIERLLDLLAVLALLALALVSVEVPEEVRAAGRIAAQLALAGFVLLVVMAYRRAPVMRLFDALIRRVAPANTRETLSGALAHFLEGLTPLTKPGMMLRAVLWTVISWGFSAAAGYILMLAFYDRADPVATGLFIATASFAIALPAVPGNIGTFELSVLLALNATGYGEPAATAGAFAVVLHGTNLIVFAIMGALGLLHEGVSLEQLSAGVQHIRQGAADGVKIRDYSETGQYPLQ